MGNPTKAIDAILDNGKDCGKHTVYPMSIARYALLEKIGSPMLTDVQDTEKTIQTIYIMTQPMEILSSSLRKGTLETDALTWADCLGISELEQITSDIQKRLQDVLYLSPEGSDDSGKKKAVTAG